MVDYLSRYTPLQIAERDAHLARQARMRPPPVLPVRPAPPVLAPPPALENHLEQIEALKTKIAELVRELSVAKSRPIEKIQAVCAAYYNIPLMDILSERRAQDVVRPRQVGMWLSKKLTTNSFPYIGFRFGGRDHTTVMHAVRRIEKKRLTDPCFSAELDILVEACSL